MNTILEKEASIAWPNFPLYAQAIKLGLLFLGPSGTILFCNDVARDICLPNFSAHESIKISENYQTNNPDVNDLIIDCLTSKETKERQISFRDKFYLVTSYPSYEHDTLQGCVLTFNDITQSVLKERQHTLLYQLASAFSVSGTTNLEQILKIAINQIIQSMHIASANIMILDPETKMLKIKIDSNSHKPGYSPRSFKLGEGLAGKCAQDLRPYTEYDIAESKLYIKKEKRDHGALLVVPIASQGKLLGVINAQDTKARYFTENEVQFLTIVANEIAIAIENSLLYDKLNHKIELLMKMFNTSILIGKGNIDNRIQQIINLVPELLECEGCYAYLYSPNHKKFILKYRSGTELIVPSEIPYNHRKSSTLRQVFVEQQAVIHNDTKSHPHAKQFKKIGIFNFVSIPIIIDGKSAGIMSIFNKRTSEFTREDINLLSIIQMRIATKLENFQLLQQVGSEKDLLDRTMNNISEGVAVLNRKRKIIVWNHYLELLTSIPASHALGQPCYRILFNMLGLKKIVKEIYLPTHDVYNVDSPYVSEAEEMRNVSGDQIWVSTVFSHLFNKNNHIENTVIVFRNITKEREFIRAKNEFVSLATHELRTPLTAIKGYLSMITSGPMDKMSSLQKKYISKAAASTERLVKLVEELLDVVRIDEDRVELTITSFDVLSLTDEVIEEFSQKARGKNISVACHAQTAVCVEADREKTKQILENLIDNAIKYTKASGSITISMERLNNYIITAVRDDGVGIPKKYLESIFDRFVRIDNPLSIKAGGTGLGLYIVKNLIRQQGGDIWVTSQVGKGTTFFFSLPITASATLIQEERKEQA